MYKTLADMTPEQRSACVGMWCYIFEQLDEPPVAEGIIAGYREDDDGRTLVIIDHPHPDAGKWGHGLTEVVPRPDLSRAWQPDGQPVPGEWEEGHVVVSYDEPDPGIAKDPVSIEGLSEGGMSYYEEPPNDIVVKLDRFGEGEGKARRWVGEWEQA